MTDQIYVMVGSQQVGPLTEADAKDRAAKGEIGPATLLWHPGLEQWQAAGEAMPSLLAPVPGPAEPELSASEPTRFMVADPVGVAAAAPASEAVSGVVREASADRYRAEVVSTASEPAAPQEKKPETRRWESHGTVFEVISGDYHQMPKITLRNNSCILEAGAMHYIRGHIDIQVQAFSASGFVKSALTKEATQRPKYTGTGEVYLEPTLGEVDVLELQNEEWVLDRGAFLASDSGVELGIFTNKAWAGLLSGEGMFQTKVSGTGKVFLLSDGVCQRLDLNNDRLVVDGTFAVARSAQLKFSVEKATKGLIGSLRSGEGFVNVIQGTGTVLLAPIPNRSQRLFKQLDLFRGQLTQRRR
ncbi:MAG TPA: AIM24 family protein [Thermoanaerobaculia bacterium]|nr:AIM24 family protein [Thermoanaerobaculia bacterium]